MSLSSKAFASYIAFRAYGRNPEVGDGFPVQSPNYNYCVTSCSKWLGDMIIIVGAPYLPWFLVQRPQQRGSRVRNMQLTLTYLRVNFQNFDMK